MTDRPILFSAPMVRALLDGRKTQTRRVLKPQPSLAPVHHFRSIGTSTKTGKTEWQACQPNGRYVDAFSGPAGCVHDYCTTPSPGDRLWVREAYYQRGHWEPVAHKRTKAGRQKWAFIPTGPVSFDEPAEYRKGRHHKDLSTVSWHKRLGRFMPRWASRLTLTVTDVRVERLQDISEADALAEGIYDESVLVGAHCHAGHHVEEHGTRYFSHTEADDISEDGNGFESAAEAYGALWNHINGPGAWDANPWIVALTFTVARHNIDEAAA